VDAHFSGPYIYSAHSANTFPVVILTENYWGPSLSRGRAILRLLALMALSRCEVFLSPLRRSLLSPSQLLRHLPPHSEDYCVNSCLPHAPIVRSIAYCVTPPPRLPRSSAEMASSDSTLKRLLHTNTQWAQAVGESEPDFFERSSKGQSPEVSLCLCPLPVFPWHAQQSLC